MPRKSTELTRIREIFFRFYNEYNFDLFNILFHPDLKLHLFDNITFDYYAHEMFCRKACNDQVRMKLSLIKEEVLKKNKFLIQAQAHFDDLNRDKFQFPVSIILEIKKGKILDFKMESSFDWSMIPYIMENVADILNGFSISAIHPPSLQQESLSEV